MHQSNIHIKHNFTGRLIGPDGKIKKIIRAKNLVGSAGLAHVIDQLYSSPAQNKMSHYAIGTGTTVPAAGDTALQTEISRVALDSQSKSGAVLTYTAAFLPGQGTGDITEAGIFNAASGGMMLARVTFTAVNKVAADTFIVTHTITAAAT